jgi:dTDP-4-dehydrorhamnose reductase
MTKYPFKTLSFENESDVRFPRARVLVVGCNTRLADAFIATFSSGGQQRVIVQDGASLIDDSSMFETIRMRRPDFVVNCLVEAGVDRAETDPTKCREINHDLPVRLAIACREFGAALVQLSTDYIFDGQKDIAYFEDDAPNPLNLYGQSRLEAEFDVRNLLDRHIILRVSHLFAPGPRSFIANLLSMGRMANELSMIEDERGCPTSIYDVARVIAALIDQLHAGAGAYGVYHLGCQGDASWFELGECVIAQARQYEDLRVKEFKGISGDSIQGRAKRPRQLILSMSKLLHNFGIQPRSWRQGLAETVERHYTLERGAYERS